MSDALAPTTSRTTVGLATIGLVMGCWAIVPPYVGPTLHVLAKDEVADHVVPGVIVLMVSAAVLVARQRLDRVRSLLLPAGLLITLCGLWMTATHVPLVRQALHHQASGVATAWHTVPGVVLLAFGALWTVTHLD